MKIKRYILIIMSCLLMVVGAGAKAVRLAAESGPETESGLETTKETLPEIYLKAINPGYTIDGISNVGEMIELGKKSDEMVSLAGLTVGYTNTSGNYSVLYEFPESSWMTGENILLRLASSPDSELAAVTYTKTIAMSGELVLKRGEEVIDGICFTGKNGCLSKFSSSRPTSLVRRDEGWEHLADYYPDFKADNYQVKENETEEAGMGAAMSHCEGIQFSEILSYYENSKSEQFIELYNPTAEQILLDGCAIRYKNKNYPLTGIVRAEEYLTYLPTDFTLTKNPTNQNALEIVEADGKKVDTLSYPNGQRKGTAYALIGYDAGGGEIWKVTYNLTPGQPNIYQEYKTCEEGKVINEETGNCVKVTEVAEKTCEVGYFLNPLTGRCKKNETAEEKVCPEGYYLNPETNRCRKSKENDGADYALENEQYAESSNFVGLIAVVGVVLVGLVYLIYEFRREIKTWLEKLWKKLKKIFRRKDIT